MDGTIREEACRDGILNSNSKRNGYEMDPSRIDWLKDLTMPETAGELCQYVHCCRWMATAIPPFNVRIV